MFLYKLELWRDLRKRKKNRRKGQHLIVVTSNLTP